MFTDLWDVVSAIKVPLMLARGMLPQSVIGDDDEAELIRRQPAAKVVHFDNAGHSIQGDMPVELAREIEAFVFSGAVITASSAISTDGARIPPHPTGAAMRTVGR